MELAYEVLALQTRHPFHIARQAHGRRGAVWVRLTDSDDLSGWGEANPVPYFGETPESVCAALEAYRAVLENIHSPFAIQEIESACRIDLAGNASARAAISMALYDLQGKRVGLPVHTLLGLDPARVPLTSFTIGLDAPDVVRRKIQEALEYPILKLKVGGERDEEMLSIVREEAPEARIRLDANGAWSAAEAVARIEELARFDDIELVEQPVAESDIEGLRFVRERSPLPVIADESCHDSTDIPRLVGKVDGVNIKLAKCGGLTEALRMIHTARAHHLQVMLGCMLGTTLGVAAAAQLAPLVDYADLDGAALLSDDPFEGFDISGGRIRLSAEPGLGVGPR